MIDFMVLGGCYGNSMVAMVIKKYWYKFDFTNSAVPQVYTAEYPADKPAEMRISWICHGFNTSLPYMHFYLISRIPQIRRYIPPDPFIAELRELFKRVHEF